MPCLGGFSSILSWGSISLSSFGLHVGGRVPVTLGTSQLRPAASLEAPKYLGWAPSQQNTVQWLCQHQNIRYLGSQCQKSCSFALPVVLQNKHGVGMDHESMESCTSCQAPARGCSGTAAHLSLAPGLLLDRNQPCNEKAFSMSVCFLSVSLMSGKSCCSEAQSTSKMSRERMDAL